MDGESSAIPKPTLGTHVTELARYVPRVVIRSLTEGGLRPCPMAEPLEGALLFADISGYSRLAEKLASDSGAGVEELSVLLNEHFGVLIDLVHQHGGDILKFAGDAILVFWEEDRTDPAIAVRRAARGAFAMQEHLQSSADGLELRIGIASGAVVLMHVASSGEHREIVVAGPAMVELAALGAAMDPREVVITNRAWARLRGVAEGMMLENGAVRIEKVHEHAAQLRNETIELLDPRIETLLHPYIPPNILPRILAGHSEWVAERRNVSVLFVQLPGLSQMVSPYVAQTLLASIHRAVNYYEGSISNISSDDKGISILITFGLPPIAHEDDPIRAVYAALVVEEALREQGLVGPVGMASGPAFCGLLGNDKRLQYVVLGDVVNRAARLMTASSSGVLCDNATACGASDHFGFEAYPPILVKGRSEPLSVFRPYRSRRMERMTRAELVGREAELHTIADHAHRIKNGREGGILLIEGEAGMGKSRLAQYAAELGRSLGLRTLHGAAEAMDANTPYHAWRSVFAELLGLNPEEDNPDRRREYLARSLAQYPDAVEFLPLLAPLFGFRMEETKTTAQMDLDARGRRTQSLLLQLLSSAATKPILILLEDAHWFDSASWQLARLIMRQHPTVLLVMTVRPDTTDTWTRIEALGPVPGMIRLRLHPLTRSEVQQLVSQLAGLERIPGEILDFVHSRAEGNPFFTEQIVLALKDAGAIDPSRIGAFSGRDQHPALALPESLQGVIISRIDNLPPTSQLVLKAASVLGRYFTIEGLRGIYPIKDEWVDLEAELNRLADRGLIQKIRRDPEVTYRFQHAITQEATYGLLLGTQRRKLHRAAARWFETQHASDPASVYSILVHHWRGAGEKDTLARYLDLAGNQALNTGAYQEAIAFLEEAQRLIRNHPGHAPGSSSRFEWAVRERKISEAYYGLGRLPESYHRLARAVAVLDRPLSRTAWTLVARTVVETLRQAAHRLGHASRPTRSAAETIEACLAYERLAELGYFLGQNLQIVYDVLRNLNLAEAADAPEQAARSYAHMGTLLDLIPWRSAARHYEHLALEAAAASDQASARALVYEAIGLSSVGLAQWERADKYLLEGAELFHRLGQRRKWEECLSMSMVPALFHHSDHAYFERVGQELLQSASQSGDRQSERWVHYDWARLAVWRGRFADARAEIMHAIELLPGSIDPSDEIRFYGLESLILVRSGELTEARAAAEKALERARVVHSLAYYTSDGFADLAEACLALATTSIARVPGERRALRRGASVACAALKRNARLFPIAGPAAAWISGLVEWERGHQTRAVRAWTKCLAAAEKLAMPHMQGLAHLGLSQHKGDSPDARQRHLLHARHHFEEAGCLFLLSCAERAMEGSFSLPLAQVEAPETPPRASPSARPPASAVHPARSRCTEHDGE